MLSYQQHSSECILLVSEWKKKAAGRSRSDKE